MFRIAEKGNSTTIVLAVVAVIAVGVLAYLSYTMKANKKAPVSTEGVVVNNIEQGNPVVAKVGDTEITRAEVLARINALPVQVRQLPVEQLYPAALNQIINDVLVKQAASQTDVEQQQIVQERVEAFKKEVIGNVFLQEKVNSKVTENALKDAYAEYVENFPANEEVLVKHILVSEESKALDLINKLEAGEDFVTLVREHSLDQGSVERDGEVGYFIREEVVPEFAEVAFSQEVGSTTYQPVKTQFGFHIIKVEGKRLREPGTFDQVKPALETKLRQEALEETVLGLREKAEIEVFDINGNPVQTQGDQSVPPSAAVPVQSPDASATPASAAE